MKAKIIHKVKIVLIVLHVFIGVGALAGGLAAMTSPLTPMGMSAELYLKGSPFKDFFIPGLILFGVIGIGNLIGALCLGIKVKWSEYISGVCAGALVIWIIVQCIILKTVVFLHVLYFGLGAMQGILVLVLLWDKRLFPVNILLEIWDWMIVHKDR